MNILIWVVIVLFVVSEGSVVHLYLRGKIFFKEDAIGFGGLFLVFFVLALCCSLRLERMQEEKREEIKKLEYAIENDYTFYLDGEEVGEKTIDPEQYDVTVDAEVQAVYMTKKSGDDS